MKIRERRALTLKLLEAHGEVWVADLSRRAGVSEMNVVASLAMAGVKVSLA